MLFFTYFFFYQVMKGDKEFIFICRAYTYFFSQYDVISYCSHDLLEFNCNFSFREYQGEMHLHLFYTWSHIHIIALFMCLNISSQYHNIIFTCNSTLVSQYHEGLVTISITIKIQIILQKIIYFSNLYRYTKFKVTFILIN